jgi:hypothetical protein
MKSAKKESGKPTATFSKVIARPERLRTDLNAQARTQIKTTLRTAIRLVAKENIYKVIVSQEEEKWNLQSITLEN